MLPNIGRYTRERLENYSKGIHSKVPIIEVYEVTEKVAGIGVLTVLEKVLGFVAYGDPLSAPIEVYLANVSFIGQKMKNNGQFDIHYTNDEGVLKNVTFTVQPRIDGEIISLLTFLMSLRKTGGNSNETKIKEIVYRHTFAKPFIVQLAKYVTQTAALGSVGVHTVLEHDDSTPLSLFDSWDDKVTQELKIYGYDCGMESVVGYFTCKSVTMGVNEGATGKGDFKDVTIIVTRNMVVLSSRTGSSRIHFKSVQTVLAQLKEERVAGINICYSSNNTKDNKPIYCLLAGFDDHLERANLLLVEDSWLRYQNQKYNLGEPRCVDRAALSMDELRGIFEHFKNLDAPHNIGKITVARLESEFSMAINRSPDLVRSIIQGVFDAPSDGPGIMFHTFLPKMRCLLVGSVIEQAAYFLHAMSPQGEMHSSRIVPPGPPLPPASPKSAPVSAGSSSSSGCPPGKENDTEWWSQRVLTYYKERYPANATPEAVTIVLGKFASTGFPKMWEMLQQKYGAEGSPLILPPAAAPTGAEPSAKSPSSPVVPPGPPTPASPPASPRSSGYPPQKEKPITLPMLTKFLNMYYSAVRTPAEDLSQTKRIWENMVEYKSQYAVPFQRAVKVVSDVRNGNVHEAMKAIGLRSSVPELRPPEGTKMIGPGHLHWSLSLQIMKGISMTIDLKRESTVVPTMAYAAKGRYDMVASTFTPDEVFKKMKKKNTPANWMIITEYAAETFRDIRHEFGFDDEEILRSIGFKNITSGFVGGRTRTLAELPLSSKTSDFIFMTHDSRLVVRSLTQAESVSLRKMMRSYHLYIKVNKDSFLTKILGLYTIQCGTAPKLIFVLMTHTMQPPRKQTTQTFSLKGLKAGQNVPLYYVAGVPFKDNDFGHRRITMVPQLRDSVLKQLQDDCSILCKNGIIDYTLTIGIHTVAFDLNTREAEICSDELSPFSFALDEIRRTEKITRKAAEAPRVAEAKSISSARKRHPKRIPELSGWRCPVCQTINHLHQTILCKHCYSMAPNMDEFQQSWAFRVRQKDESTSKIDSFAQLSRLTSLPFYKNPDDEADLRYTMNPIGDGDSTESEEDFTQEPDRCVFLPRTAPKDGQKRETPLSTRPQYPLDDGPCAEQLWRLKTIYEDSLVGHGTHRNKFQRFFGGLPGLIRNSMPAPTTSAALSYRTRLLNIYQKYNPEKAADIDDLLRRSSGREEQLIANVVAKYGPEPKVVPGAAVDPSVSKSVIPEGAHYTEIVFIGICGIFTPFGANDTKLAPPHNVPPEEYRKRFLGYVSAIWH